MATVSATIGKALRERREAARVTQDDVARSARGHGLTWGRSTVAQLEGGTRDLSADELLLLPMVVDGAGIGDFSLASIVAGLVLEVGPDARISGDVLVAGLTGVPLSIDRVVDVPLTRKSARMVHDMTEIMGRYQTVWPKVRPGDLVRAERAAGGEAERKAAARFGVTPMDVAVLAQRRWGRSLTARRDELAEACDHEDSPRTVQARRGRITRRLLEELATDIRRLSDGTR